MGERDEIAGLVARLREASAAIAAELGADDLYGVGTFAEMVELKEQIDGFIGRHE